MLLRKIKNRIYHVVQKYLLGLSFVDVNVRIDKSVFLRASEIHGNVRVEEGCMLYKVVLSGDVTIGRNTSLWGPNIQLLAHKNPIEIGKYCSIARDVTFQEYFHDHSRLTTYYIGRNIFGQSIKDEVKSKGAIKIGNDVWIGTGVQIMSGVTIGHGAVIAANATVTNDVPPYAIVGGVPGKILKYRFSREMIESLLQLKWWDWTVDKIKNNKQIFSLDEEELFDEVIRLLREDNRLTNSDNRPM